MSFWSRLLKPKAVKASAKTDAPVQWLLFALQHPQEARPGSSEPLVYSANLMVTLDRVNRQVNRSIQPVSEKRDVWTLSPQQGDCDDFAVTKRHLLRRAGLNQGALRVAVVTTPKGEQHAVLVVKTTAGDFVLDNLTDKIHRWDRAGLRLNRIQTADPAVWAA